MAEWISVKERLPREEECVLLCVFGRSVGEGVYRGYDGHHRVWKMYAVSGTYWDDEVTHWMQLPEPPEEGGGENGNAYNYLPILWVENKTALLHHRLLERKRTGSYVGDKSVSHNTRESIRCARFRIYRYLP